MLDHLTKNHPPAQVLQALSIDMPQVSKAASEWYIANIQKGRKAPFCELVTLTPERAEMLLAVNESNRNVNERRLADITSDIIHSNFELNGETIVVSRDGLLNDGQHRCLGVINTGTPIKTFIVFGVERNSRLTVDTGTTRTAGNFIAMDGGKDTNAAAVVSLWLLAHRDGLISPGNDGMPTKAEIVSNYFTHRDDIDDALRFVSRREARELRARSVLAVAYIVCKKVNPRAADEFFSKLCDGAGYDKTSAIHATRRRMFDTLSMRLRPGEKLTVILGGWNAWRRGETPRTIQIRDKYPRIEA